MSQKAPHAVAILLFFAAGSALAEGDSLFLAPSEPYVAPGRIFQAKVPSGWVPAQIPGDPNTVEFRVTDRRGNAVLIVRRITVPRGAQPRQILLKAIESRLSNLPYFQLLQRRSLTINGIKAESVLATYAHQGNIQYPRALEEVVLVVGEEAFLLHFECFEPAAAAFADDINMFYGSFAPRPAGADKGPFAPVHDSSVDKIDF